MAQPKRKKEPARDYAELIRGLRENGPGRLYLLWGEESYLRDSFSAEIKKLCFPEGADDFSYRRFGGIPDMRELGEAVDAVPFFSERTLVEVRDAEINRLRDSAAEELKAVFSAVPDCCTVVLCAPDGYEPDGRLAAVKAVKKYGEVIEFRAQSGAKLTAWIARRFAALGKRVGRAEAEYLIFRSGSLMTTLVQEIAKIAAYAAGEDITRADIDAAAHHLPEAVVYDMTDRLAERDFDGAAAILAELLAMRDEPPTKLLAAIGQQMRRLYCARLALDGGLGRSYVTETCGLGYDFLADKLLKSARSFTEEYLAGAVEQCAECDFKMKSSSEDDAELLRELLLRLAVAK